MASRIAPYCGSPPDPAELLSRWNLDPILIGALLALGAAYWLGAQRAQLSSGRQLWFLGGWALAAFALISPLCPLSVSLFAARVGQHMLLTLVAAPMVAMGRPQDAVLVWLRAPGQRARPSAARASPLAAGLFAVLLWYWHAPGPYAATFDSTLVYWSMHVTLFGSAIALWITLLDSLGDAPMRTLLAGLGSTVQMGLVGALITLSPEALYTPHFATTAAWGLTPLDDQQLGGALMWIPGCTAFLAAAMAELATVLERAGAPRTGPA